MRLFQIAAAAALVGLVASCSSPQDKAAKAQGSAYKAQEELTRQRLEFVDKYRKCVSDAGQDALKVEACDSYLKAAEALQ